VTTTGTTRWSNRPGKHKNTDLTHDEKLMLQKILDEYIEVRKDMGEDIDPTVSSIVEKIKCIHTEETFFRSIYDFLVENRVLPFNLPTIEELGKMKGGYGLVRIISTEYGGLKAIRPRYTYFASELFFKSQPQTDENFQS
tara:strand:- start:50 stop:469 length:420 start_codon:yes stop_codon:yes gene_type:complete